VNSTEPVLISISGAKDVIESIRNQIDAHPGSQSRVSERKNLDGNTAAWIVIATLAGQALPHVLTFIKEHLASKRVKKIKVGDWEVENPTPEMIDRFLVMTAIKPKPENTDE
jgi:hypothetical protein